MTKEHYYRTDLRWKEGRLGVVSSPELPTTIECATPPEFDGGIEGVWSPEHFYSAAITSCFMTTFLAIAKNSKVEFESFDCTTKIKLELVDRKYMITEAEILPTIKLIDFGQKDRALRVIQKTKENCLVTNSMKTEVSLVPNIV